MSFDYKAREKEGEGVGEKEGRGTDKHSLRARLFRYFKVRVFSFGFMSKVLTAKEDKDVGYLLLIVSDKNLGTSGTCQSCLCFV